MSKNYKLLKRGLTIVTIILFILLIIFTIDVINDEPDWAWFQINFDSQKVANYSTLISGLLSFLAIMFVIFNIVEQREQLEEEKKLKNEEVINDYNNRLNLLKSLLVSIISEIKQQGERMKKYYQEELAHPTQANNTHFSANKSFSRIMEMDYLMNYQTIQYFFQEDKNWEKMFLEMNSNVEFYSGALLEHRQKYQNHIADKVNRHKEIASLCEKFYNDCIKIIEKYRTTYGNSDYLQNKWASVFYYFLQPYNNYNEKCKKEQIPADFRFISNNFFLEFLRNANDIKNEIGFDNYGSEEQVILALKIRRKIYKVEMYSIQYANNIKYYFDEYFDENCKSFKEFKSISDKVTKKLQE